MTKPDLKLISKPASTESRLFEAAAQDDDKEKADDKDTFAPKVPEGVKVTGQIAGRVPASNGAFGFINGIDPNISAGLRVAFFNSLQELGLGFIKTLYDNSGGDFEGPLGAATSLKYQEKCYDSGNRYIREDEVRKACDEAFRRDGREIVWVESEASATLGGGTGGSFSLGALPEIGSNFKVSGIARYRRLEPFETASGKLLKGQAFLNAANIPVTATLARRMPVGGEFDITGEGNISFAPELEHGVGPQAQGASIGASAKVNAQAKLKGETTVSVQRLPFGDEVLVKIAHAKAGNIDMGAAVTSGAQLKKETYEKLPQLCRGALKFIMDRMGLPDAPAFVKKYLQSQIQLKSRYERRNSTISRFVFDLSKPAARQAYEDIFTRFSLAKTRALVEANDGSVRAQKAGESATVSEKGALARIGDTKLYLLSALQAEREGNVSIDGRAQVLYRDSKFERNYINWLFGEQNIKWEAVTVDKSKSTQKSYFHLAYMNRDRMTSEGQIEKFLSFARCLGIRTGSEPVTQVLADRDDTETRVDIYFSDRGIKKVASASRDECLRAYLETQEHLTPSPGEPKAGFLDRFLEISQKWFFIRVFYWAEISRLRADYAKECPGRNIDSDAKAQREARQFAESVSKMASQDEKSVRAFFMGLAKANGFEYMSQIAALTKLAGEDESILHELSISGGGLTLGAVDEGEILHPEKAMNRMLTRMA